MNRHDASRAWFCRKVGRLSASGQYRLKAGISKAFDHASFGVDSRAADHHSETLRQLALVSSVTGENKYRWKGGDFLVSIRVKIFLCVIYGHSICRPLQLSIGVDRDALVGAVACFEVHNRCPIIREIF